MNGRMQNKVQIITKRCSALIWGIAMAVCLTGCQDTKAEQEIGQLKAIEIRETMYDKADEEETEPVVNDDFNLENRKKEIMESLADKEYPGVPEPFCNVLREYEQIIMVTQGLDWDSAWDEFNYGGWKYVYNLLYGAGRYDNIYYSFYELTGDEFPEMIMGRIFEGQFRPYTIYYFDGDEVWGECPCERYDMTLYENDIVEMVGPVSTSYLQYKPDTDKWECVEYLEIRYYGSEILGYIREDLNSNLQESVYEEISEEEYRQIIEQYRTTPINLEWTVLWEVVG